MPFHSDATQDFFHERSPASKKKTEIVTAFFKGWATIMERESTEIVYIDLFAGRGFYDRDAADPSMPGPILSTPLLILRAAIENVRFRAALVSVFNDGERRNTKALEDAISRLPGIELLKHRPEVTTGAVDHRFETLLGGIRLKPTLFFLDPFGYKGLTRKLIASVLKDWGCDVVFFVNYKRLNMAIGTNNFDRHLDALFGDVHVASLREEFQSVVEPEEREALMLRRLEQALGDVGGKYFISFRFRTEEGKTSHHLALTTKHYRGYAVMKEKMAQFSGKTEDEDKIPLFEFVPERTGPQIGFFAPQTLTPPRRFPWSVDALSRHLLHKYPDVPMTLKTLFEKDNVGTPYLQSHYRAAIWKLVDGARAQVELPDGRPARRSTCPPNATITINRATRR